MQMESIGGNASLKSDPVNISLALDEKPIILDDTNSPICGLRFRLRPGRDDAIQQRTQCHLNMSWLHQL
jgi:hypothetical protein